MLSANQDTVKRQVIMQPCLETLPDLVLQSVFENLDTFDLINLAAISKYLRRFAVNRLYRKIYIYDSDRLGYKQWVNTYPEAFEFTALHIEDLPLLIESIQENENLAGLIYSVCTDIDSYDNHLDEFYSLVKIEEFFCKSCPVFPSQSVQRLSRLSCHLDLALRLPSESFTDLRINYGECQGFRDNFKLLGESFVKSSGYKALKSLNFTDLKGYDESDEVPAWYSFLDVLRQNDISLELRNLGLTGDITNAFDILNQSISLSSLTSLELDCHYPSNACFQSIKQLLSACKSLQKFRLADPSYREYVVELVRDCIPRHQLKVLDVQYSTDKADIIRAVILDAQRNLTKLTIQEWSPITGLSSCASEFLNLCNQFNAHFRILEIRETPYVDYFELPRPAVAPDISPWLLSGISAIKEFLCNDTIYQEAGTSMPFLSEYVVHGIHVDMMDQGLIMNGVIMPFDK